MQNSPCQVPPMYIVDIGWDGRAGGARNWFVAQRGNVDTCGHIGSPGSFIPTRAPSTICTEHNACFVANPALSTPATPHVSAPRAMPGFGWSTHQTKQPWPHTLCECGSCARNRSVGQTCRTDIPWDFACTSCTGPGHMTSDINMPAAPAMCSTFKQVTLQGSSVGWE